MAITQEMIDRINELAKKKKAEGLTEEEAAEPQVVAEGAEAPEAPAEAPVAQGMPDCDIARRSGCTSSTATTRFRPPSSLSSCRR